MKRAGRPIVSAIVPIYNVERFLDQALSSIEAQTLRDIEIVCVNDGSTDRSPEIVRAHAERDERIRVIDKPNGGYGSACNCGIEAAQGEWIAIVEPDDWIEPTMFDDMTRFALHLPGPVPADIVKTPYWRVTSPDTPDEKTVNCSYKGRIKPAAQPFALGEAGTVDLIIHHPSIWSALYRTAFFEEKGIRFLEIPGAGWADNPFLLETLCQASAIAYLDRAYYHYREETPSQAKAAIRRDPFLLFDRWNDMMDVLDRLDMQNEAVRRAVTRRGFTYLESIAGATDLFHPDLQARARQMFDRMDDALVLSEAHVPPRWKAAYARAQGLPEQQFPVAPYARSLAGIGLYNLLNVGPAFTLRSMRGFLGSGEPDEAPSETEDGAAVKLSVVVPVYNAAATLDECFGSLLAQTHSNLEIVFVDDGSTDATAALLADYMQSDARVRVVTQENGGPSAARNAGIRMATGDYIMFLDADDLLEPDAGSHIARLASYGETDAIVFGWTCFGGRADHWTASRANVSDAFYPAFDPALVFEEPTQPFLRLAMRRAFLADSGILFDESLHLGEDAAFALSLLPLAHGVRLASDKLYRYRLPHAGSLMQQAADNPLDECLQGVNTAISVFGAWAKHGLLARCGEDLVAWSVRYSLYTVLRQEPGVREQAAGLLRDLWLAHWTEAELRTMALPAHAKRLVLRVLDGSTGNASADLLAYRLAEYGSADLAASLADRVRARL